VGRHEALVRKSQKVETHDTHKLPLQPCTGGCHCGAVRFEVDLPGRLVVHRCNCTICTKTGYLHVIVESQAFRLIQGQQAIREYQFNTGTARHLFCMQCGVKSFYVPRSHPEGYSVNLSCLELDSGVQVIVEDFDGRHWRQNVNSITVAD
jgi:hypothetical protein